MPNDYFLYIKNIECKDTGELCKGYKQYLTSKHWDDLRKELITSKSKCQKCGKSGVLQLHHVSYENLGNETRADFMILCPECHKKIHNRKNKQNKKKQQAAQNKNYKNQRRRNKKKKKCVVFNQADLREATAKNVIKRAYVNKFDSTCYNFITQDGIQWCSLGYKKCPFLKCMYYKKKN